MPTVMVRNYRGDAKLQRDPNVLLEDLRKWCIENVGDACPWRVYEGGEEGGPSGKEVDDQSGGPAMYWVVFATIDDRALALRLRKEPRWKSFLMESPDWDRVPTDLSAGGEG